MADILAAICHFPPSRMILPRFHHYVMLIRHHAFSLRLSMLRAVHACSMSIRTNPYARGCAA